MNSANAPIAIGDIAAKVPEWPFSKWATWRYAREGRLKTIKVGRRRFVSIELLEQFLVAHTEGRAA